MDNYHKMINLVNLEFTKTLGSAFAGIKMMHNFILESIL